MGSIVARYTTLGEAEAARSALDAAGIACRLADHNLIAVQWLYANAVGWVKLLVPDEQRLDALEVLTSHATPDESAGDEMVEAAPEPALARGCPACNGFDVQRIPRFLIFSALCVVAVGLGVAVGEPLLILIMILVLGLLAAVTPSHRCRNCGERWNAEDAPERPVYAPPPTASDTLDVLCPRCGAPELHRVYYRRLVSIPLVLTTTIVVIVPVRLLLPRWKCDSCGRRLWFR